MFTPLGDFDRLERKPQKTLKAPGKTAREQMDNNRTSTGFQRASRWFEQNHEDRLILAGNPDLAKRTGHQERLPRHGGQTDAEIEEAMNRAS